MLVGLCHGSNASLELSCSTSCATAPLIYCWMVTALLDTAWILTSVESKEVLYARAGIFVFEGETSAAMRAISGPAKQSPGISSWLSMSSLRNEP